MNLKGPGVRLLFGSGVRSNVTGSCPCVATFGVIGDKESACWYSIECEEILPLLKRCGPLGPSTCFSELVSKWNADLACVVLGVWTSSYDESVVKLGWPDWA